MKISVLVSVTSFSWTKLLWRKTRFHKNLKVQTLCALVTSTVKYVDDDDMRYIC